MILKKFLKIKRRKAQSILEYLILFSVFILVFTLGASDFLQGLARSSDNFFQGATNKIVGEPEVYDYGGYYEPSPLDPVININAVYYDPRALEPLGGDDGVRNVNGNR